MYDVVDIAKSHLYAPTPRLSLRLSPSALKASVTPKMASGGAYTHANIIAAVITISHSCGCATDCALLLHLPSQQTDDS